MTIDEAIKELKALPGPTFIIEGERAFQAAQLGIEALTYIDICRHNPNCYHISPLPGETEVAQETTG